MSGRQIKCNITKIQWYGRKRGWEILFNFLHSSHLLVPCFLAKFIAGDGSFFKFQIHFHSLWSTLFAMSKKNKTLTLNNAFFYFDASIAFVVFFIRIWSTHCKYMYAKKILSFFSQSVYSQYFIISEFLCACLKNYNFFQYLSGEVFSCNKKKTIYPVFFIPIILVFVFIWMLIY